jgi:hypothetical protein
MIPRAIDARPTRSHRTFIRGGSLPLKTAPVSTTTSSPRIFVS